MGPGVTGNHCPNPSARLSTITDTIAHPRHTKNSKTSTNGCRCAIPSKERYFKHYALKLKCLKMSCSRELDAISGGSYLLLELVKAQRSLRRYHKVRHCGQQGCGSGFNRVSGSGSGILIRIQEGKNDPQK